MVEMRTVQVSLDQEQGWWIARSKDLPGLFVSNRDVAALGTDIAATIKVLMFADFGLTCEIETPDLLKTSQVRGRRVIEVHLRQTT